MRSIMHIYRNIVLRIFRCRSSVSSVYTQSTPTQATVVFICCFLTPDMAFTSVIHFSLSGNVIWMIKTNLALTLKVIFLDWYFIFQERVANYI
jgi:hypothetical protein